MKVFSWFTFLVATQLVGRSACSSLSTADLVAALPKCALVCLTNALSNSTCSPTDRQCICTNTDLNIRINECVVSTCTIKESLTAQNVTSIACDAPVRDKRNFYNTLSTVFGCVSGAAVALRLLSRYLSDAKFGTDDYAILFTLFIGIPGSVMNVHGLTANGLGKDLWTLTFKNVTDLLHVFFVSEILYFAQLVMVKISILFFYLRIFPGSSLRKLIYGTIIFNVIFFAIFGLVALLQCRPISYAWKKWDGEHQGTCLNNNALGWANAGISIVLDIWMLYLPMTQLLSLNLHWKKKVGVAMMFSVGAFVTIVSIIRIKTLVVLSKSSNPSWDYVSVGYWSTIEINVGIICACMPNLRLLLVRLFPTLLGTTHNASKYTYSRDAERSGIHGNTVNSTRGGIMLSKTYDVDYSHRLPSRGNSEVELVDAHRIPL